MFFQNTPYIFFILTFLQLIFKKFLKQLSIFFFHFKLTHAFLCMLSYQDIQC